MEPRHYVFIFQVSTFSARETAILDKLEYNRRRAREGMRRYRERLRRENPDKFREISKKQYKQRTQKKQQVEVTIPAQNMNYHQARLELDPTYSDTPNGPPLGGDNSKNNFYVARVESDANKS